MRSPGIKQWRTMHTEHGEGDYAYVEQSQGEPNEVQVRPYPYGRGGFTVSSSHQEGMSQSSQSLNPRNVVAWGRRYEGGTVFRDRGRARLAAEALNNRINAGRKHHDSGTEWEDDPE